MKTAIIHAKIGEGIFLTKDVAHILQLPPQKIRYWLKEFWDHRFGKYSFVDIEDNPHNRAINFNTLIEFIVFAKLREKGISSQKIQKIHHFLAHELNTQYPFAKTKFLTDKPKLPTDKIQVWFEYYEEIIRLDNKKQISIKKLLEPFLNKIEFDKNAVAQRYFPLGTERNVVIDPKHQFGQPTILGTNIKAETIYFLHKGNEPKENICFLYNINIKQVNDAIAYCEKYGNYHLQAA